MRIFIFQIGKLPEKRVDRKCRQLENFVYIVKNHIGFSNLENVEIINFN